MQHDILGRRGRKNDPLYKSRRTLLTRISYLSDANKKQLFQLFADEHHLEVDCTWSMYQRVVSAYNEPDRKRGKKLMEEVIVRRQNIRHNSRRRLAECGLRLGVDVRRRVCGVASAYVRWSFA